MRQRCQLLLFNTRNEKYDISERALVMKKMDRYYGIILVFWIQIWWWKKKCVFWYFSGIYDKKISENLPARSRINGFTCKYVDDDFYPKTIDFPILMDEYEIDNFYITSVAFIFFRCLWMAKFGKKVLLRRTMPLETSGALETFYFFKI